MGMCITVASIQVQDGRKPSVITTTEGIKLKCFPDKVERWGIEVGASFNVETSEYIGQKGFKSLTIENAKRVTLGKMANVRSWAEPPAAAPPAPAARSQFRTPKEMFVSEVLTAYIANGRCAPEKLTETIRYIMTAWEQTFGGNDGTFLASEAGHGQHNGNGAAPH
jgi:hypothetical protein